MKTDWLLAVGCSLTWGSEITEPGESLPEDKELAWPTHLGKLLGASTVVNRGWPGRSNGSIYRVALADMARYHAELGSNGLVVVQWSGLSRMEIINPRKFDLGSIYEYQQHHPGQESGPYLNLSPGELLSPIVNSMLPGLAQYFTHYWQYKFYLTELLVNYSLALTALADKLGIRILQFNGIEQLEFDVLPDHARYTAKLIGSDYYYPADESACFWRRYQLWPGNNVVPRHPTAEQHADWANVLYNYMLATQSARSA